MILCPACNSSKTKAHQDAIQIRTCKSCGALFGRCYKGDSGKYVSNSWAKHEVAPEKLRYYDLELLGSQGITRIHGWYDPETKLVHQTG